MAKVKIPYLVALPGAGGKTRYYWQPSTGLRQLGWRPERLPDDQMAAIARARVLNDQLSIWRTGTDAAPASAQAEAAPRGPQPGTVGDLIRQYKGSRFFTEKSAKTKRGYLQNLKVIEDWAGDAPVAAIGPQRIQKLYEGMRQATPAKANAIVTMLRILLQHAVRLELVKSNAAAKPGMIGLAPSGRLWPADAVELFVEVADRMGWPSIGTAVIVNHWLGQRQGDILALKRQAYRAGVFHLTQRKTGARVSVPHSDSVHGRVDAELRRQHARKVEGTHLLLCETTGQAWKEDHFRHVFAAVRAATAAEWPVFEISDGSHVVTAELQFMHLRHTAVTALAVAGCTALEIAGITGHTIKSVDQILDRYLVRTSDLAVAATQKRLAWEQARNDKV